MTVLQFLKAIRGLTVLDVVSTEKETKFFLMAAKDISFSNLHAIEEQLDDIREIIVYTHESKPSPNGEECQLEIVVNNSDAEKN